MAEKKRLGELLVDAGLVTPEVVERALQMQVLRGGRLGEILVSMGAITDDQQTEFAAQQLGLSVVNPSDLYTDTVRGILPRYICQKFNIMPMSYEGDNILNLAMWDPLDHEAIESVEKCTGKAVQPCLARKTDITKAIRKHVKLTFTDIFNPLNNTPLARGLAVAAIVLVVFGSVVSYQYYKELKYGTVTHTADATLYKNRDLIVGIDNAGKATLLGRGAYADGYYRITFDSVDLLGNFIEKQKDHLSDTQYEWAQWALTMVK